MIKLNYVYENDYNTRVLATEYEENANYFIGVNLETERKHMYAVNDFKQVEINKEIKTDPIVGSVITKYLNRSAVGIKKYGTTLHENNTDNFLNHLQEELFDASLYIEKLMSQQKETEKPIKDKVLEWAYNRNLLYNRNKLSQYGKLQEESLELYTAILNDNKEEIEDAIGDIGIVMIILANQLGYDFFECIEKAYNVIKDRKGKTVNGSFIKE